MQHSVKEIANRLSAFSDIRKDKKRFVESDFIQFANKPDNKEKFSLIENGDDLLVSSWHSDDLIQGYRRTII